MLRLRAKDRDGWLCVLCGKRGRLEVDHIMPVEVGGEPHDMGNLQTLCRGCHIEKTRRERKKLVKVDPRVKAWRDLIDSRMNA